MESTFSSSASSTAETIPGAITTAAGRSEPTEMALGSAEFTGSLGETREYAGQLTTTSIEYCLVTLFSLFLAFVC